MNDFYEVNDKPVWDANLGRWIEPDEILDSEDETPVAVEDNPINETREDCGCIQWPSIEEQLEYWKTHDHGGNVLPSRIEANDDNYGYPNDWPKCPGCGLPSLDGHITCGQARCDEGGRR